MTRPDWTPPDIDLTRPSVARMYDYNLGGSHNFEIDRTYARNMNDTVPDLPIVHRANRSHLRRVVRFFAEMGIRQYLDIGSGIPTVGNVHEIAQRAAPESRIIYVDIDAVAVTHSNAILADNDLAAAIQADARNATGILSNPTVRSLIDFNEPVGVLMLAVLHFITEDDDLMDAMRTYREALCPGSYLAISHPTAEGKTGKRIKASVVVSSRHQVDAKLRDSAQLVEMFEGFDIVEPGVVFTPAWRPDSPDDYFHDEPDRSATITAVGVKR